MPASVHDRHGFVGRDPELSLLGAALGRASAAHGSVAVISGELGVGKTRLVEAFARLASAAGALVAWARCYDDSGSPAFWPWVEVVRAIGLEDDLLTARTSNDLGGDATEARFRLFQATAERLRHASQTQPLVVVFDDVQWADPASLALFEFVAHRVRDAHIVLIATRRVDGRGHDDPLNKTLTAVLRTPDAHHVELSGLDPAASRELLEVLYGDAPPDALADELYSRTQGNPLFLIEIARASRLRNAATPNELPATVRQLIGERLVDLPEETQELLRLAAVAGGEFSARLLEVAGGWPLDAVLDGVELSEAARLIVAGSSPATFRFSHPLIREVLVADLPMARRARLHRRVGEAVAEIHADDDSGELSELAFHFAQAISTGTADRALRYARRAAERAMWSHAFEDAVINYELALSLVTDRAQRVDVLLGLGEALNNAGELARAAGYFEQAAAGAREQGAVAARQLGRAALGLSVIAVAVDWPPERVRLVEEAIQALGEVATPDGDDVALRIRLMTALAGALSYSGSPYRRDALLADAHALATELGDPGAMVEVLVVSSLAAWRPEQLAARAEVAEQMAELAVATRSRNHAIEALRLRIVACLDAGDMAGLDAALADHAAMSSDGFGVHRWRATMWKTMRLLLDGRLEEAERNIAEAAELSRDVGHPDQFLWFSTQTHRLRHDQGRLAELEGAVRSLVDASPHMPVWRAVLAGMLAAIGRVEESTAQLERVVADLAGSDATSNPFAVVLPLAEGLPTALLLAEAAVGVRDAARAAQLYDVLLPYAAHGAMAGPAVMFFGCVAHRLSLLASLCGNDDAAQRHHDFARLRYERMGARPWLVRLACDRAAALLARPGTHPEALRLLGEATALAGEVGMAGVVAQAASLAGAANAPVSATAAPTVSAVSAEDLKRYGLLTERELAVLRLIAAGHSNVEIGAELLIAAKTVMHHAASIYRKLGVRGRAEAASFVTRVERGS